ncbi:hypothetical protein NDU88_008754 [Pleurodeles waltl]|uniref:Uncharacterized protein n=1 Tax=Pleurodeles waltl TaxID=8319 RepID=A0AAV7NX17_PLEWA|nr:hypothetical protein NDU88_008754 [Pleurodeles waltl]
MGAQHVTSQHLARAQMHPWHCPLPSPCWAASAGGSLVPALRGASERPGPQKLRSPACLAHVLEETGSGAVSGFPVSPSECVAASDQQWGPSLRIQQSSSLAPSGWEEFPPGGGDNLTLQARGDRAIGD